MKSRTESSNYFWVIKNVLKHLSLIHFTKPKNDKGSRIFHFSSLELIQSRNVSMVFLFKVEIKICRKCHMWQYLISSHGSWYCGKWHIETLPALLIRYSKISFVVLTSQIGYSVGLIQHFDTPLLQIIEACHLITLSISVVSSTYHSHTLLWEYTPKPGLTPLLTPLSAALPPGVPFAVLGLLRHSRSPCYLPATL